jgi:hypothetical protein
MELAAYASEIICLTADVLILVSCFWAYRRFHLRSVPWISAYLIFQQIWPILASLLRKQFALQPPSSGSDPYWLGLTVNDFAIICTYASRVFASAANLLIAWFIISEVSYSYSNTEPQPTIPAFMLMPVQHSCAFGIALLFSAMALPLLSFMILVLRT